MEAELLVDCRNALGEMPLWNPHGGELFWIDVPAPGRLFWMDTRRADVDFLQFEHAVTGLARCASHERLLVAAERRIWTMDRSGRHRELLYTLPDDPEPHRFNDGAVDRAGRFWVGSMPNNLEEPYRSASRLPASGRMFVVHGDGGARCFPPRFACPNAICWSPDAAVFYTADSVSGWIHAYDFDLEAGEIRNGRHFCRLEGLGIPDGAAVDSDGCIWNARWGAGVVARIDPVGRLIQTVPLPVTNPTACCFGGVDQSVLYVTTARHGLDAHQLAREKYAGGVFAIQTASHGTAGNLFDDRRSGRGAAATNSDGR